MYWTHAGIVSRVSMRLLYTARNISTEEGYKCHEKTTDKAVSIG